MTKSKKAAALVRLLLACPVVTARAAHIRRDGASKASVELAVMSMCPDAVVCEQAFAPVLKSMSDQVDLSLSYIGTRDERGAPACMHGAGECEGNVQQLCAHRAAKGNVSMLMDFVLCQGEDRKQIPANGRPCAERAGLPLLAWEACSSGPQGSSLLLQSMESAGRRNVRVSCTVFVNGEQFCQHNEEWVNCGSCGDDKAACLRAKLLR
ncbi:unnamed protein product [Prorocentrum cordatum]|uniref:Uncharacterized protein n=1 Tax=Prorocentrum cordatum TaxID=2364126 RepID=A0ABN9SBR0_9DINO|nr:unnamed protein product [Polarella glacialis]